MRFGSLILAACLLVGCGNKSTELTAIDQCMQDLSIHSELVSSTSDYDKATALAKVKMSCAPIFKEQKLFEEMALSYLKSNLEHPNELKVSGLEFFKEIGGLDWIGINIGIAEPQVDSVYPANIGYGISISFETYLWNLSYR